MMAPERRPVADKQDRPPKGKITEQRVSHLVGLMVSGQYIPHHTKEALAKEWDLKPGTVEHYACEASRRIRAMIQGAPELRALITANLQTIVALSMKKGRMRDAIEALRVMAGVADADGKAAADVAPTETPTFRIEITNPERPVCPPPPTSGSSSPTQGGPATD